MLLPVLVVGVVVSVIQAAHADQRTAAFVPKVVAQARMLAFFGPWMLTELVDYIQRTLQELAIPGVVV